MNIKKYCPCLLGKEPKPLLREDAIARYLFFVHNIHFLFTVGNSIHVCVIVTTTNKMITQTAYVSTYWGERLRIHKNDVTKLT